MVGHLPAQEVRRLAHAPAPARAPWMRLLRVLPLAPGPVRMPARRRVRRHRAAAFSYYRHAGRLQVVGSKARSFGIPAGTWIAARLTRVATSANTALIVLRTRVAVRGRAGTLAAGSVLLARAEQVVGDRLMLSVREAVTPHGDAIPMSGVVFDGAYHIGLCGFVKGRQASRSWLALGRSLVQSADQALSLVGGGGSTPAAALGRAGRSVLGASIRWRRVRRILYVPPQFVEVQLEKPI